MRKKQKKGVPIICIASQKGGVGKTTTAAALIDGMRLRGLKVLGIDCDPQGSLSDVQGPYILDANASTDELFTGGRIEETRDGQATTRAYEDLAYIELSEGVSRTALKDAIQAAVAVHGFDAVVIDTHPDKSFCAEAALLAATHIIIPTKPAGDEISGVAMMVGYLNDLQAAYRGSLELDWKMSSVITLCKRSRFTDEMIAQIREELPLRGVTVLEPVIHHYIMVDRAKTLGESLFKPGAVLRQAANEYYHLVGSIMDWAGIGGAR